jgi:D-beta-D-heptose 7-phosphate kinase/D-beta-D-heptose 1-phosphate adenosyltransferase
MSNKIIFTNGCFDILHVGHLKLLKQCKKLGNKLIVALNSDDSIRRLKGLSRPINNLEKRMVFIKELNIADEIVYFDEDTPECLLKTLRPDILVKGGDYDVDNVKGSQYVKQVVILPYIHGFSTTSIINNINTVSLDI